MMNDQELRQLVRESVARHLGRDTIGSSLAPRPASPAHPSHGLLPLLRGGDGDGACLIEPSVRCNHCGYCLSYGH
jgi:hypothetical protein